jgi:hypothetical protein
LFCNFQRVQTKNNRDDSLFQDHEWLSKPSQLTIRITLHLTLKILSQLQSITSSSKNITMSPRGNKSKSTPSSRFSHFRSTDTTSTHEHEVTPASTLSSSTPASSDSESSSKTSKAKVSKVEQFDAKTKKLAAGVGKNNRKLTPKEKKCLMKERKKVEKMESKIRKGEEMAKAEQERGEGDEVVENCEV